MEPTVLTPQALGIRIALAREEAELSQGAVAERMGLDRSAVNRIESGARKVSAAELVQLASLLERPIEWFVTEAPDAVVNRRREPGPHTSTRQVDLTLESLAMDLRSLVHGGLLAWPALPALALPTSHEDAERLAEELRGRLDLGLGPVFELGAVAERLGVYAFSLDLGHAEDGASAELLGDNEQRLGVALVNGQQDPGRRRWTLAHEMGHLVTGDAYTGEANSTDVERYINSFVSYFLMPRSAALELWSEFRQSSASRVALALAARFRTSWSAACSHLRNVELIDYEQLQSLLEFAPTRGDYLRFGEDWVEELAPPYVPPAFATSVLAAYVDGALTSERTLALLRGTLAQNELPEIASLAPEELRRAFDAFP